MSVQPPGRRTESLFDNRYRYDHIYPRGRSGETLRAYDTHDHDRPVVIKRPAPQDAPPMRAGQEVSIRKERQALERLAGHPVLTELRASGTFRVGGQTHEYIVMDLALGEIVEEMIFTRAERDAYLPELETLVIMDRLLDLLARAHDHQVIYNDVDAKHLFWDRLNYRLKVIDWGNAVFLDEPGALPSVNRATDIYQCGELLYFILTGGSRLSVEIEDDNDTFFVNFGPAAEHIPARLQGIISRAVHPDAKQRFGSISELRSALREHRTPLEQQRDEIIGRVRKRVRPTASQDELEELRATLQDALIMDPGHPEANQLQNEINHFLAQIHFQADLDAIRIYIESANWPRALSLLHDLQSSAGPANTPLLRFLIASAALLNELNITPPPRGFLNALDLLFTGQSTEAGQVLLKTSEPRPHAWQAQWLLAEQLAAHVPEVALLRPHLTRLRHTLQDAPAPVLAQIDRVEDELNRPALSGLTGLHVIYQQAISALGKLEVMLDDASDDYPAEMHETQLASVIRARRAANDILAHLDQVGNTAYSDPPQAVEALRQAAHIDPTATHFNTLHDYFDEVHQAVTALAQFRPRANGANLAEWFDDVQNFIRPYLDDLPDPQLHAAAHALQQASEGWITAINYLALGRRQSTIEVLRRTGDTIRPVNEHIAAWMGALANRVPDAGYAERLSPNEALADRLIEGWKAWDRGDGIQAAQSGQDAHAHANTDGERLAADRLRRMGELLDTWASAGGYADRAETDHAETEALSILLSEEERERRTFAEQMPNTNLYLRAMSRGIVAYMQQSSSAGWRALYMHYVLRGMLALFTDQIDEAEFWREVASKGYDSARTHRAFQILDRALTSRLLIEKAQRALNAVARPGDLEVVQQAINVPLAGEILADVEHAVGLVNDAIRSWSDGEFYDARQAFDGALHHIDEAMTNNDLAIDPFAEWVAGLRDDAAELQQLRLSIEQGAASSSTDPDPAIEEAQRQIVTLTQRRLGPDHVHQVRQWHEMYQAVLETYTTQRLTRAEKLAAFSRHFASLFIARHPAYPLFRHWEGVISQLPADVDEDETIDLGETEEIDDPHAVTYLEDDRIAAPAQITRREPGSTRDLPWNWIIGAAVIALIALIGFAVVRSLGEDDQTPGPGSRANAAAQTQTAAASAVVIPTTESAPTTDTPIPPATTPPQTATLTAPPEPTSTPFAIPTTPPATATEVSPPTLTPTLFVTSTLLPTRTPQPVAALSQDAADTNTESSILAALDALPAGDRPGPQGAFVPSEDGAWILSTTGINGAELALELSPELLSVLFQPGAASALRRADATLELLNAEDSATSQGEIAFGLGATNATGQQTIGQVEISATNFVRLGLNQNGRFISSTEFPQQNPQFALSIRRTNTNTLSFYVDDRWLGDSVFLFPQGDPVTLLFYVTGQDVAVRVSTFEIDFSPRDVIP